MQYLKRYSLFTILSLPLAMWFFFNCCIAIEYLLSGFSHQPKKFWAEVIMSIVTQIFFGVISISSLYTYKTEVF